MPRPMPCCARCKRCRGRARPPTGLPSAQPGCCWAPWTAPFATQLLAAQLGPLLDYDSRRGTQLVLTAWTFLENDASGTAAAALHVHPNTLRQRLERIDTILGASLRRGGRFLDIHVALRLWPLQSAGISGR